MNDKGKNFCAEQENNGKEDCYDGLEDGNERYDNALENESMKDGGNTQPILNLPIQETFSEEFESSMEMLEEDLVLNVPSTQEKL